MPSARAGRLPESVLRCTIAPDYVKLDPDTWTVIAEPLQGKCSDGTEGGRAVRGVEIDRENGLASPRHDGA